MKQPVTKDEFWVEFADFIRKDTPHIGEAELAEIYDQFTEAWFELFEEGQA